MLGKLKKLIFNPRSNFSPKKYEIFTLIKSATKGYLSPEVYSNIYSCARNAQEGNMIDIGPAQGGSSISLCLGIRDSNKKGSKVFSIEKGKASSALVDGNDVSKNLSVLQQNISNFGLSEYSVILMGDVSDVYHQVDPLTPISLLFIDADGALDRDFHLFYDRLLPNAPIVIDDYEDVINKYARERYLLWETHDELNAYVSSKGQQHFYQVCPLGKNYTTYRFVNYFLEQELIVEDKVIGNTFFGHKASKGSCFTQENLADCHQIRLQIEQDYYDLNPELR